MKIVWEVDDIVPGRVIGKSDRTERWKIGYLSYAKDDIKFVLVSMSDGMVTSPMTKEALAAFINTTGDGPTELTVYATRGRAGGHARAAAMTPEARSSQASKAATARWNGDGSQ